MAGYQRKTALSPAEIFEQAEKLLPEHIGLSKSKGSSHGKRLARNRRTQSEISDRFARGSNHAPEPRCIGRGVRGMVSMDMRHDDRGQLSRDAATDRIEALNELAV